MSAQAGTAPRRGIRLDSRLLATARSEWIKFRSVRSGPLVLVATALIVVVGAWLLGDANRSSYLAASPAGKAAFDPVFTVLQGIELAQLFVGALGVVGLGSRQIGELAAERGHVLHQLCDVTASLEEAYFRLTGESVEYRAAAPVAS